MGPAGHSSTHQQTVCLKTFQAHSQLQTCPLDTLLPTKGLRLSSTQQWPGTIPALQEACTSLWISLTHQGADTRHNKTTIPQPAAPVHPEQARPCPATSWSLALSTSRPTKSFRTPQTPYPNVCQEPAPPPPPHPTLSDLTLALGAPSPAARLMDPALPANSSLLLAHLWVSNSPRVFF